MNDITDDHKKSLTDRDYRSNEFKQDYGTASSNNWNKGSEQKFMHHFESININGFIRKSQATSPSIYAQKFGQTIENYKIQTSTIDDIFNFNQNSQRITPITLALAEQPSRPNLNARLMKELKCISQFFEQKEAIEIKLNSDQLLDIQVYSTILQSLGRKNNSIHTPKMFFPGNLIVKGSNPAPALIDKDITVDNQQRDQQQQFQSMKKIELIMLQLFAEKRRKNCMTDYFYVMELKLMELLEYILKDETQYADLDPSDKMRLVLKNLDKFKGKYIDGESKICLLRVFFEEFATLKKEKQHHQAATATPVKKVLQKSKPTTISKNYQTSNKKISSNKKQTRSWQQQSFADKRSNKSVIKDDDWLGQLK